MRIITRRTLLAASRVHPEIESSLDTWYRIAKKAEWKHLADVQLTWRKTDQYGSCTIFDIKGNDYRLIVWINYNSQKIFIRHVLTHAEYSKEGWKNECSVS